MLSKAEREKCADILLEAERVKKQATQLSTTYPGITTLTRIPSGVSQPRRASPYALIAALLAQ
mgnify:CR=1 FL=1